MNVFCDMMHLFIYLFIFCCYWCFLTVFWICIPPDAWWTAKKTTAVGGDISGVCSWSFPNVFSEKWSFFASHFFGFHSWMPLSSEKTENLFCLLLLVSASHSCHILTLLFCCSVGGKIRNDYWLFIKNAWHSLFNVARRDFQTVLPIVCTLSVAWVTKICFDTCGNWSFLNLQCCSV